MRKTILAATIAMLLVSSVEAQSKKNGEYSQPAFDAITYLAHKDQPEGEGGLWATLVHGSKSSCSNCHIGDLNSLGGANTTVGLNRTANPHTAWLLGNALGAEYVLLDDDEAAQQPGYRYFNSPAAHPTAGAVLELPGTETRNMLGLPEDSGIIVRGVCKPMSKNLGGLKTNDIVLFVNEKPAKSAIELDALLATTGELAMVVLRDGEKTELKRDPAKSSEKKRYLMGVTLGELDPVVKAQLKLDDKVTVFVRDIAEDGAAKEAGIKPNDIFVRINDESAPTIETVRLMVQKSKGKPIKVNLRRGPEVVTLRIKPRLTGEVQAVLVEGAENRIRLVDVKDNPPVVSKSDVRSRLDDIDKKLSELTDLIKSLKPGQ